MIKIEAPKLPSWSRMYYFLNWIWLQLKQLTKLPLSFEIKCDRR